jgi:type VI secretion system protein VasJ
MPLDATDDLRLTLGRDPVPGPAAAGSDIRDRPEFETLDTQIRLMESGGVNAADWKTVVQVATVILRDQGKDLLVAAYLAFALWQEEGLHGLATGLTVLRDITLTYWAEAQPPLRRLRGRVSLYDWLASRLGPSLEAASTTAKPSADAIAARDALDAIDDFLAKALGASAPALGPLQRAMRSLAARAEAEQQAAAVKAARAAEAEQPKPQPPQPTAPSAPVAPPPVPSATAAPLPAPPALSEDVAQSLSPLRDWMRQAVLAWLVAHPTDPRAYGLLAQATWLPLDALPDHQGGRTVLPAPSEERLGDILSRRSGPPAEFILAIAGFCSGPGLFWLDGQYLIAQTLKALGPSAATALAAHEDAVKLCLSPLSGLTALTFDNGTPFLADAGRAWMEQVLRGGEAQAQAGSGAQPWVEGAIAAQDLLGQQKTDEAFAVLTRGAMASAGNTKAHFLAEALRLALRTNDLAFALSLAKRLTGLVTTHRLAEWDAAFASDILDLAARCLSATEIGRFIAPAERQQLMADWSISLSDLNITRGRDALKTFAIVT